MRMKKTVKMKMKKWLGSPSKVNLRLGLDMFHEPLLV